MRQFIILSIILAFVASQSIPQPPIWPNIFAQDFIETWTLDNNSTVRDVGTYYYNYANNTHRLARSNGQNDPFCGFNNTEPLACDHIVINDDRYMYFPETNECCYCCGFADGCAILKPQWFINPTFLGVIDYYGTPAYSWVIYEEPNEQAPNFYYETTEEDPTQRKTLYIARQNYKQNYLIESLRYEFPAITLPNSCNNASLCPGVCEEVRGPSTYAV